MDVIQTVASDETLKLFIVAALSAGCGTINQGIIAQIVKWREEDGQPMAPKTKRRVSFLLAFLVPTLLYLGIVGLSWVQYGVAAHFVYIAAAFMTHQAIHGETKLSTVPE